MRSLLFLSLIFSLSAYAEESSKPERIVVEGRAENLLGIAESSSQGFVGADQLKDRPFSRPGEVAEAVPGMIITQHAGGGKANQYYLRGFNLDHGTDFALYVDGVPVNMPTHAHGLGYADLNWLIPELVQSVAYAKGPYYAEQGDFGNAGYADINYYKALPQSMNIAQFGSYGYRRDLLASSAKIGSGNLLFALEGMHNDGAWDIPANFRRLNGVLRYSDGDINHGYSLSAQGYYGIWNASDPVPQRAIDRNLVGRFGSLDSTVGGSTHRFSAYGEWHNQTESYSTKLLAYAVNYKLDLFSDFTYALNDAVHGDEVEQKDDRWVTGIRATQTYYNKWFGRDAENSLGLQARADTPKTILNNAQNRIVRSNVRTDKTFEMNIAPWYQNKMQWNDWLRSVAGIRYDIFRYDVTSAIAVNTGSKTAATASPKLSFVFGPWYETEYYIQAGVGIRSNDARSIVGKVNPDGTRFKPEEAIVRSQGGEIGVRSTLIPELNTTLALWTLHTGSEPRFSGDSGAVEDSGRPGSRYGVEWNNFYTPVKCLDLDLDLAYSRSRYADGDPDGVGKYIPDAVTTVATAGITLHNLKNLRGFHSTLRLRSFGPRPLVEDNSQKSAPSTVLNAEVGYAFNKTWSLMTEVLNLTNSKYNDAEYYYATRLKNETAGPDSGGYNDHMVHAGEPISVRAALTARF